jgi:chromosomal replication initiation ATPase DnaA
MSDAYMGKLSLRVKNDPPPSPDMGHWRELIPYICRVHRIGERELREKSQAGRLVAARWHFWTLLRAREWSYPRIGRETGHDHTTVIHGVRRWAEINR